MDDGGGTSGGGGGGAGPTDDPAPTNPCLSLRNRPDYCDEAGSCFDANIGNDQYKSVLTTLEAKGTITDRWEDTNADAGDQDKRAEKNSFIIQENGSYRAEPFSAYGNITTTSCTIHGSVNVPSNAVGVLHFQPFNDGERITSRECLEAQDFPNPDRFLGEDAEKVVKYNSEPSGRDRNMAEQFGLDIYVMDKDNITVVNKEGATEGAHSRCGY
jgi:hypothetical protein